MVDVADAAAAHRVLAGDTAIELLFTDVVMPGELDGVGLARLALCLRPGLRVLLTSGFPAARAPGERIRTNEFRLLAKPYHQGELAHALRDALDHPAVLDRGERGGACDAVDQRATDQRDRPPPEGAVPNRAPDMRPNRAPRTDVRPH